ncbi:MAG TPA: flagellar biosynthetic protein FliR, partial [Opitutales bacterium]|nr:flagellar biosynthetic protein FliR [Opitutales bacterium]
MLVDKSELIAFFLAFARIGGLLMIVPVFAGRVVPLRIRIGFSALMAYLVGFMVPQGAVPTHVLTLIGAVCSEILIGVLCGLVIRMIFFTIEFAAHIMTSEMGLSMGGILNPGSETPSSALGNVLFYLGALIFFCTEAPHGMLYAWVRSFSYVPAGEGFLAFFNVQKFVQLTAGIFELGVKMAAPMIAINF